MLLKREEIIKAINVGEIIINPYDINSVKEASIELTIGEEIGIFRSNLRLISSLNPSDAVSWTPFTKAQYVLKPNERVVGKTKETITLSNNICGWITPRGRTVTFGLNLSIAPGFVQPGTTNENLFFIITNVGQVPVLLHPGIKIVQLILMRL